MPKRIQLPNGEWVYVPDMDSYFDQITSAPRNPEQQFFSDLEEEEEEERDEGTLAGSAWEGFKSIPSGVADIFLSGAQAAVGVVTPFADLPVEKRLRRQASKRARERDPAYRDAFLPAVGTGLGQVAGLSALSRLPGGWYAAMGAGVGMGISEQTRRIADYEQRTGTDVPWYKESSAHMMGALIGLSEVIPIKFGLFPAPIKNMMGRMKAGLSPSSGRHMSKLEKALGLREAVGAGLMEATQEASAQWLQALSARGLYDPNAMEDIAHAMAEDFKVGGVVGGIAKLVTHQILGSKFRNSNANAPLQAMIKEREYRQDQDVRDVHGNITGIVEDLPEILRELGTGTENRQLAKDITHMFGGEWAAIPFGMDALLKSGSISRFEVEGLVKEFINRNEAAKAKLDEAISRNPGQIEVYTRAKNAIDKMATDRIANLSRKVTELGGGLGEMGGLSSNLQYQAARQAAIESDADASVLGVFADRKRGMEGRSYLTALRSLMGGSYGVGGFFKMAELLGIHRGPGSEQVNLDIEDGSPIPPDLELSSSNRANFSIDQLGEILFSLRGKHEQASKEVPYTVDQSDVLDGLTFLDSYRPSPSSTQERTVRGTLRELNERLEELQTEGDNLYKNYAFTREASEAQAGRKYAGDAAWIKARNEQQRILSVENQRINAEISQINRDRSIIHLRLLSQRLKEVKVHFAGAGNLADKQKAAKRVFGKNLSESEMGRFDTWLDQTIRVVEQSERNGDVMAAQADAARKRFDEEMARTDVSDADKEAFTAKFLSENSRRFVEFPRDISAPQLTNIANLFLDDRNDPRLQATLALRALGDISNWQVQDKLYEVDALGLPDIDPTAKVVEEFVDKLNERVGITTDRSGKMSTKDGKPEDISVDDITKLLRSKNIYLRDGRRIGNALARRTKIGVESRPFEKLLLDMTGASTWKDATYAQRLLMYSRLLQLPAHYQSRGNLEEQLYLEVMGMENYRPLFLPDFYHDPNIDSHINFMADNIIEITEDGEQKYPSWSIGTLREETEAALGDTFDSDSFDEALARLIETGVFNPTADAAPDEIISPETWESRRPVDESQVEMGLGGFTNNYWIKLLKSYGVGGKNPQFPWGTIPDDQRPPELTNEEWLSAKWTPVIKNIFPEISGDVDVEFVLADDPRLINNAGRVTAARHLKDSNRIIISYGKVQELAKRAKVKKGLSVKRENANIEKYLRHVSDIDRDFFDTDEVMLFVLAHEIAHKQLPSRGPLGSPDPNAVDFIDPLTGEWAEFWDPIVGYDMDAIEEFRGRYENQINRMALAEVDRYMMSQAQTLYEEQGIEQKRKKGERLPAALSETRVRFNVNYDPLSVPWSEGPVRQPGDSRVQDTERWIKESDPKLIRKLLADKDAAWKNQVDDMWAAWNERNPKDQLSRKAYIERYTALITSSAVPLQELSDMGVLDTVQGAVAAPDRMAPTESILALDTAAGRGLVHSLMRSGALPSSMQDNVQALRRRFTDTIRSRFEVLDRNVEELVKKLRLPDNIQRQYVDDVNGLFQFMGDVAIRGEEMRTEGGEVAAMYDRPGNRIIINLAAIDPNNMVDAQDIVKRAAFHEGIHALIIRDHLSEEELNVLYNFVRNDANIVPEEVDKHAHDAGLTWFQRSVAEFSDRRYQLNEADIEKEAVISLLESLVRFPAAMNAQVKGAKVRKIGKGLGGFLEGFIDAAKDADIVDVMKILSRIERGEVGDRGAGFLGDAEYTPDSIVRSNDLLRYADPEDIKKLRAAVVLRDAAPSDRMRESEQAKVDDIVDKIVANRGIIQESAPPIPDAMKAIENQRELIKHYRDTYPSSPPLLGLNQDEQNSDAYKIALDTFMEMRGRDPRYAYKMPAPYQTFFDNQPKTTEEAQKLAGVTDISTDKDPARELLKEDGALDSDKKTGDDLEATRENLNNSVGNLRYNYLDRRQWVVEQTDRLMAEQNRAQLDAETSALVMWRNSDNALNWLPSLMLRGPLSYLGTSVGAGRFENAPVYDNDLQENYGGDGRIQGLNDILALVIDSKDSKVALDYGIAKRIAWTEDRLRRLQSSIAGINRKNLSPEIKRELEMFEEADTKIKKGMNLERLRSLIEEVETNESNKIIIEFWDRYNAYNNHMIKMSYNTGMITREQRDEWLSMPYTPFYREMSEEDSFPVGSQQEIVKRGINKVEKALQGSMEPVKEDLMDNIITNTQALVRDAMMNVSASRTARDAVALGDAKRISISDMAASADPRVIRVMENGVPVFYQLKDPQLAMSVMLMGANPKRQLQKFFGEHKLGEWAQKLLTGSSQLLRETVTKTPPFAIKNVFRDSWQAMSLTGGGPKLVLEAFSNALDPDILRRAEETGLSIGIDFVADPGEYGNKMRNEFKKANLDWKDPKSPFIAAWNALGRIAKQSEVATRVAVYDRILAKTGDKALALHYAVEIMNYGRRGADPVFSTYMATIPFMNGRLQGLDVTYRGLRSKKGASDIPGIYGYGLTADEYSDLPLWKQNRAQIAGRGLMLTFATGLLYLLMREDDEWQDLRDEVKTDNWVLPLSDHAWLKIPIPFEIGVLFKVIPEKMFEAILEKDVGAVDVGEETIRQLRTSLGIMGFPQLFAPVIGAMSNYDKFRKDAIVDPWMEETLSANEQRNMYTSNVARTIADFANDIPLVNKLDFLTSPMKVEYMARQYLGTGGSYAITLADRMARTGYLPDIPYDPYMNLAEAESIVGTNKDFDLKSLVGGEGVVNVPMLGDLLTDPRTRGGRQQQFYEAVEELDTVIATLNSITERDRKKGFEYREKHLNILRHKNQLRYLQSRLRKWRERRDHLAKLSSEYMSNDEKREYYQRLLESRQGILAGIDTIMDSIKQG